MCTGEEVKHYQIPRVLLTINQQRQLNKSMMLHRGNFFGFWCWWSLHWDSNLISQEMLSRAVKFTLPSDGWNWPELRCMQISSELNCTGQCANEEPIDSYHGQCWLLMPGSANLLDLCWSLSTAASVFLSGWEGAFSICSTLTTSKAAIKWNNNIIIKHPAKRPQQKKKTRLRKMGWRLLLWQMN